VAATSLSIHDGTPEVVPGIRAACASSFLEPPVSWSGAAAPGPVEEAMAMAFQLLAMEKLEKSENTAVEFFFRVL
jgi:hypothetical protein